MNIIEHLDDIQTLTIILRDRLNDPELKSMTDLILQKTAEAIKFEKLLSEIF